ncbi:ATP-binding protein [Neptuniibacter sp.]|uniref:sensor histidine kinase n=1 Tax=Neptuniibacter sp. TaxID=1962643 RepID=UPI00263A1FF9|nr:ATP-binding protein [Neptuniibacter sp.]MCP4598017.1 hypothetical protein [Neptuniibacter sp.]
MNTQKAWPLRLFLSSQFALVAIIPLLVVGVLSLIFLLPKIEQTHSLDQKALATSISGQVKAYLDNAATDMQVLASFSIQTNFPDESIEELLDLYASNQSYFEAIYLTDEKGKIEHIGLPDYQQYLRPNFLGLDLSYSERYKQARSVGRGVWTETFLSAVSGRLSVAYAQPLLDGVIIGEISVDELPKLVFNLAAEYDVTVMILDKGRQLIAHPNLEYSLQQLNLSDYELVKRTDSGDNVSLPLQFQEDDLFGTAAIIPELNWMVIAAQDRLQIEAEQSAINQILLVAVLIGMLAAGVTGSLLSKEFISGFSHNTKLAQALAEGVYMIDPKASRIRELNWLGESLKVTSQAINKREQEICQLNAELEHRVEERTEDLRQTNTELHHALHNLKITQDELIQSEKLAALGALVAGLSHELNTPIGNSMMASSTLAENSQRVGQLLHDNKLKKSDFDTFIAETESGNQILMRNLERASELIRSFKQVAVDQSSSSQRPFILKQLLDEILITLIPMLKKTRVQVNLTVEESIKMDSFPGALAQIITNLVQNALVHGFPDNQSGTININAARIDGYQVLLTVEDDGLGIPLDKQTSIFDPFFTTKLGQGGSGIGLHIVHNLVNNLLQGTITVSSEPGQGTSMQIRMPCEVTKPEEEENGIYPEDEQAS